MTKEDTRIRTLKNDGNKNAVIYVHGFASSPDKYYLPDRVKSLRPNWDAYVFGYRSKYFSRDNPTLGKISQDFVEKVNGDLGSYENLVFVGNSVGGLPLEDMLHSSSEIEGKTRGLLLFATPSGGIKFREMPIHYRLVKPILAQNPQIMDIKHNRDFIASLKRKRAERWGSDGAPFPIVITTGDKDERVRSWSSMDSFQEIPGVIQNTINDVGHNVGNKVFRENIVVEQILKHTKASEQSHVNASEQSVPTLARKESSKSLGR